VFSAGSRFGRSHAAQSERIKQSNFSFSALRPNCASYGSSNHQHRNFNQKTLTYRLKIIEEQCIQIPQEDGSARQQRGESRGSA